MYPELSAVINSIASERRVSIGSYKSLRTLIKGRIFANNIITSPKEANNDELNELALYVAKSLYVTEFIRAKQVVGGVGRDHRFYTYSTRSNLLDSWNKEQNITWEIHPTFARALNIVDSGVYNSGGQTRNFRKDLNR
jgi:fructose-bisphosphate aldolase class 1